MYDMITQRSNEIETPVDQIADPTEIRSFRILISCIAIGSIADAAAAAASLEFVTKPVDQL